MIESKIIEWAAGDLMIILKVDEDEIVRFLSIWPKGAEAAKSPLNQFQTRLCL
jgi:hypothetical protein